MFALFFFFFFISWLRVFLSIPILLAVLEEIAYVHECIYQLQRENTLLNRPFPMTETVGGGPRAKTRRTETAALLFAFPSFLFSSSFSCLTTIHPFLAFIFRSYTLLQTPFLSGCSIVISPSPL